MPVVVSKLLGAMQISLSRDCRGQQPFMIITFITLLDVLICKMTFFTSVPPHRLFFQSWGFNSPKEMALLLVGLAVLSLTLEILKNLAGTVKSKILKCIDYNSSDTYTSQDIVHATNPAYHRTQMTSRVQLELPFIHSFFLNLVLAGIYVVRILIAYLLMLAVMTYNYLVLFVIVSSAAVGYYLLPLWTPQTPRNQNEPRKKEVVRSENETNVYKQIESTV